MLATVPAIEIADMLDQTQPGQLGPGPLVDTAGDLVLGFQVGQAGHDGIRPLELEEDARGGMLLIAVPGKQHADQIRVVRESADSPVLKVDFG